MEPTNMFTLPLDLLLLFAVTTPIVGWVASRFRKEALSGVYASVGLAVVGAALFFLFQDVSQGIVVSQPLIGTYTAHLRVDMLGVVLAAVFVGAGLAASIYSIAYMKEETGIPLYFTLLLTMIGGMMGVVFAGDLFTLFVFWELMCISSYVLVAFSKGEIESVEAAFKYLVMSGAGSATVLLGVSLLYGMSGTLNFEGLALAFGQAPADPWLFLASLLILAGFGVKAAIVPLHTWLPDAHSAAPSPISALLSGVVIEVGVYALCRTFFSAFVPVHAQLLSILAVLSVITMLVGNTLPLVQSDVKRLLAYSSIGHVGYMLVGLSIGTQLALTGTFLHIFNHALMKGVAFLCAGAIIYRLGTRQMDEMAGIGKRMPVTAFAFSISLLALLGLPPMNGFISELTLVTAAFQAGSTWLGVIVILNSILSSAFYLRVIRVMLQPAKSDKVKAAREAPLIMLVPIVAMAAMIVIFGLWPDPVMRLIQESAAGVLSMVSQVMG
jgi:proton-translocating NADH-quinone oxidoreductase chain N